MISGAGHDAAYVARVAPAAMIFVPAATASATTKRSTAARSVRPGAQVLLQAVLDYDRQLADRFGWK